MGNFLSIGKSDILVLMIAAVVVGCSSSKESTDQSSKNVREYEKEFDPKKYDVSQPKEKVKMENSKTSPTTTSKHPIERVEKMPGFRVQIYSTPDVDMASRNKESIQTAMDSLKVYLLYDAPYYKIRIGDCTTREEAIELRDNLREMGFTEAWVVPDQIFRMIREER